MSNLGTYIEQRCSAIPDGSDLPNLLNLFLDIARSQSLVVSIPVIVLFTKLLRVNSVVGSPAMTALMPTLVELCGSRMIRYDNISENVEDPILLLLFEDIDTLPERHAFLGNYRRYCSTVIELVVRQKQSEAIYHVLHEVDEAMKDIYVGQPPFSGLLTTTTVYLYSH